ncbi:MAG: ATP-grasp domain-containing protein [Rhodospirillaceae bacterium]|jgi:carbamoyl-phosphate synthase large subunit|nr:ATP-grasp domain-containing protein [Rhodospirillaceae bacterium]MBT6138849.1 ATP-grasp domain-containing protein [Rhodospirillaceae bacterium]
MTCPGNWRRVLITGCQGDIARGLAGILGEAFPDAKIYGTDLNITTDPTPLFSACDIVPRADAADYFERLAEISEAYDIDLIIPMSEAELARFLAEDATETWRGLPVLAANATSISIGLDKLATMQFLQDNNIPTPWTCVVGEAPPVATPCILKQRRGQGGKGLLRVEAGDVADLTHTRRGDLWQELLLPDDQEYTCALYRSATRELRTIVFRRQLRGGITGSGEVVEVPEIEAQLRNLTDALDLVGAINVQLRLTVAGPRIFEINPRFSSTVDLRHRIGFQDFLWSLSERAGDPLPPYVPIQAGTTIER